jgi:hypothetical protein
MEPIRDGAIVERKVCGARMFHNGTWVLSNNFKQGTPIKILQAREIGYLPPISA